MDMSDIRRLKLHAVDLLRASRYGKEAICIYLTFRCMQLLLAMLQKHEVKRAPDLDEVTAAAEAHQASTAVSDAAKVFELQHKL